MTETRIVMVCDTCGRFRRYEPEDRYCIACGSEGLSAECGCGRPFDYVPDEPERGGLHCPRCGRDWRGRRTDDA